MTPLPKQVWSEGVEGCREPLVGHLRRLTRWSVGSILGAGLLMLGPGVDAGLMGFCGMTIGWAVVNIVICAFGWYGKEPKSVAKFREFLMLNVGLNVGYVGVGVTMGLIGEGSVAGMGWAVVIQGVVLEGLDVWLLRGLYE